MSPCECRNYIKEALEEVYWQLHRMNGEIQDLWSLVSKTYWRAITDTAVKVSVIVLSRVPALIIFAFHFYCNPKMLTCIFDEMEST